MRAPTPGPSPEAGEGRLKRRRDVEITPEYKIRLARNCGGGER